MVRMLVIVGAVWGLSGCQGGMLKGASGTVSKDKLIALGDVRNARWDGQDLSVLYGMERRGNQVRMSGAVRYADSLRYNFTLIRYFYLSMFLTDADGRVLKEEPLTSSVPDSFDGDLNFDRTFVLPEGAAFFAFRYNGQALDSDNSDGANPTNFWEYPAH